MKKWYEQEDADNNIVISGRVRLARNINGYPFPQKMDDSVAEEVIQKVKDTIKNDRTYLNNIFEFIDLNQKSYKEKLAMLESHTISPELLDKKLSSAVLLQNDESISILLNEEDHIRIQAIISGNNIDSAFEICNKIDDLIEEHVTYAYDTKLGYLTSCLTNIGTGMRASFMLHLPLLEANNQIPLIVQSISKLGLTMRGMYGEGSEPMGSIYQISNQITLGKSEKEIIDVLKNVTKGIIQQEENLRKTLIEKRENEFKDKIYRSYGILKHCKKISQNEAMMLLSDIRIGLTSGILDIPQPKLNIYNIMINIKTGNLQKNADNILSVDEERAEYLNNILN